MIQEFKKRFYDKQHRYLILAMIVFILPLLHLISGRWVEPAVYYKRTVLLFLIFAVIVFYIYCIILDFLLFVSIHLPSSDPYRNKYWHKYKNLYYEIIYWGLSLYSFLLFYPAIVMRFNLFKY